MSTKRPIDGLFSRRALIAAGGGAAVFGGLIARLFQLQIMEHERFEVAAAENGVRLDLAPPQRGRILDRFGRPLAAHRQAGRVSIVREQANDLTGLMAELSKHLDISPERQARLISEARRQASFQPVTVKSELSYEDFSRLSVLAPSLPGLQVEMAATRSYPRGRDFAHVLGYVAKASEADLERLSEDTNAQERAAIRRLFKHPDMRTGRSGVERYAEDWLRGEAGFRKLETNAAGRIIREFDDPSLAPKAGRDLYLTVDAELQKFAIDRFGEESGAAVVLDIETGDILAFVSTPAFDPNDFVNGISSKDYALLRDDVEYSPLYHKAYDGTYPPGSTFKMVVAAAALEAGVINPNERVYCPGHYRFGNNTWHCWKKRGHGSVNMHWAIKGSCDVYFYEIAKRMGIETLADMGRRFGFGQRWELGLTGGRSGVMPDDAWKRAARGEPWYEGETLNIGIGQGQVATSPLQLAVMTARIAAEGKIVTPRIIGDGPRPDADIPFDEPLDAEIMQRMKAGMYGVTSEAGGTALRSGDLGLGGPRLAGKTGTSQVRRISAAERASGILKGDNIARRLRDHALFVAYAPHDDPKYAISVVVEHGEGGSKAAAPVARDIMAEALRIDARRTPSYIRTASTGSASGSGSGAR
ncbi:MAG: penicillin-binding protein 2 [Hyphomonas sp.]|nr:penicillin-binding protein 2 [Hyphomonas sp.]